MNINLEYYKIFCYVARYGRITTAAEELCISQPAVSQAIKHLEQEIGTSLFIRTGKGVVLTTEGRVLYEYVNKGYEMIQLGEKKFMEMANLEHGEIRIGASDMTLQFYLLPYLEAFHQKYPNIKVTVSNAPTPRTIEHLHAGRIDFGVVSTPYPVEDFMESKKVRLLEDVFVAGSKYENYKDQQLPLSALEKMPLILLENKTSTRKSIDRFMQANGVSLNPEFELATSDIIVQFALRNLGVACVVKDFAEKYLEEGRLFALSFDRQLPIREMHVITAGHVPLSIAASKLLDMLETEVI